MSILAAVGIGLSLYGTLSGSRAAKKAANAQRQAAYLYADALEERAESVYGAGQLSAEEQRRQANVMASRAQALLAFQGGSLDDPGAVDLIADIEGEGAYRAAVKMYETEMEYRDMMKRADISRKTGQAEYSAGRDRANAIALSGAASLFGQLYTSTPSAQPSAPTAYPAGDAYMPAAQYSSYR